ncbi:AraC family transcriptional regulator [Paraburkholderia phosphatilytica]|uniref:AraC family transcriptional regulator n=1 Tax=Paraburkholderia phosphatilytica TaxID=2282883 RepID=UPI000E472D46|nr:AraC family transcriptional regulator [Paraburkholderia phosphatilytica]
MQSIVSGSTIAPIPFSAARASLRSSAGLGWDGFGAELIGISAGVHRVPAVDHHRIGVHVGAPVRANCLCNGRRLARLQSHGDADVIPAGLDGEWADDGDCTVLRIWLANEFVERTVGQLDLKPSRAQIRPQLQLRDKRLEHLAWALRAELESDSASDPLYAESLCTAIVVRLIDASPKEEKRRRVLMPKAAARVIDYIESHLDTPLTLAELAALVGLSVPHFKVLFRETVGMPVHRYVVGRRVERACALLRDGRFSAAQVALETGFAHQSHLAYWTRRLVGVTPREIAAASSTSAQMNADRGSVTP